MVYDLTYREQEIVYLISMGFSSKEIAQKLFISKETVRSHRKNIFIKMDARNVAGLVRRAFENKILEI
ncbi:MAG: response regulator transcription factor [Saprospiraceae bacterium]|nr:hypothetical protein [Bacteroidia bacterium]NNE16485.1 response regulator transcription factor [Saprospiraceae bacterium]NNL93463.1 response regulator transcription factor [Saprospiraceae bacterium]